MKKRLLAMILTLCLIVGLLPMAAFAADTTVSVSISDYATANSWTNDTQYSSITMDSNISVTATGGSNTGKYYANGNNWRIYQSESPAVTISAADGVTIKTAKITYSVNKDGVLTLNGSNVASGTAVEVNAKSVTFGVGNTGTATNGQVRITAIEVVYGASGEPACEHANTTTTTVDATCASAGSITKVCDACGATVSTETIPVTDHANSNDDGACDVCGLVLSFTEGTYVIWEESNNVALTALAESATYGYMGGTAYDEYGSTNIFTLVANDDNTYKLLDCYDRYIYMSGTYNSFNVSATEPSAGADWALYLVDGGYYITNALKNKSIGYSSNYSSFGSYATDYSVLKLTYIDASACNHQWSDATCDAPKTCSACGATEGEALGHNYQAVDGASYKACSVCGKYEPDSTLPLDAAIALGASQDHNTYTADKYYVTGVITEVYNTTYGNMKITDEDGNILTIYGTYNADGSARYDVMETKPVTGDTVTIYGIIGQYSGTAQIKNGWITEHVAHEHDYEFACSTVCTICEAETRPDAACKSDSAPCVDGLCEYCGNDVLATAEHEYFYPCDGTCMNCYELTNEEAKHTIVHVDAVEATCQGTGNIEYWYCSDCGACWADEAQTQVTNRFNIVVPAAHTYDNNCDWDCNGCGEFRDPPHNLTTHVDAKVPANCKEEGYPEHWICADCGALCENEDGTGVLNPAWMYYTGDHTRPEGAADCAVVKCTVCGEDSYGTALCVRKDDGTPLCQNGVCANCGDVVYGEGHAYAEGVPLCQSSNCIYCQETLDYIYECENDTYATCSKDGVCIYGCGKQYPATGEHGIDDPCAGGTCWLCWQDIEPAHEYTSDCDPICDVCEKETREPEAEHQYFYACDPQCMACYEMTKDAADHKITHVEAVAGTDCQTWDACAEYWYCEYCQCFWADENLRYQTHPRNLTSAGPHIYTNKCDKACSVCYEVTRPEADHTIEHVAESCYNIENWYCTDCGTVWADEALTQQTNRFNVIKVNGHKAEHVAESCYNIEHWYCEVCQTYWADADLQIITNRPSTNKAVPTHDLKHYEETCTNVEFWTCSICQGYWLDEALTLITNSQSVRKPHAAEHVAETCYNVEYWYCDVCEGYYLDEACTRLTNRLSVIKATPSHKLEAVAESCYNTAYWYCSACETYWADADLRIITNRPSTNKAVPTHTLTHYEETCTNVEFWTCSACEGYWLDADCTRLTNSKSVNKVHAAEHVAESCYNVEYWYCDVCEGYYLDEACTRLTNRLSVIKAEPTHKLVHVEESCYNVEHWYCEACETVWTDKALTQISNRLSVIKAEPTHKLVHEEETCYSTEHWCCEACETVWADEALTQLTNHKNVMKAEPTHKLVHEEETCYSIEHWCCEACETVWTDKALTQISNHKSIIKATPTHKLVHVKASKGNCKTIGNIEHWYCEACETVWADEALTKITNHMSVKTGYGDHNWIAATCTTPKTCTICKETVGKAVPHIYSDGLDGTCDVCEIRRETTEDRTPVHMFRMYDPNSGEHFYTGSTVERDNLVAAGWKYEGIGFTFSMTTGAPVYRLYDPATGEHLYTMDEAEKAKLLAAGWNFEGIAFNSAYNTEVPQYRLHNPNATRGAYMFTSSVEERDYLISLGWEDQGIAFYSSWN